MARWRRGQARVEDTWLAFHHVSANQPLSAIVQLTHSRVVVHDDCYVWVSSLDGRHVQHLSANGRTSGIAPLADSSGRFATGGYDGSIDVIEGDLSRTRIYSLDGGPTYSLLSLGDTLVVEHKNLVVTIDLAGHLRQSVSLPALPVRLSSSEGVVLVRVVRDIVYRVDRGEAECLGQGFPIGNSKGMPLVWRSDYTIERYHEDESGSKDLIHCETMDQPYWATNTSHNGDAALFNDDSVALLREGASKTIRAWTAPKRIKAALALDDGSLLVAGEEWLWLLEGYFSSD